MALTKSNLEGFKTEVLTFLKRAFSQEYEGRWCHFDMLPFPVNGILESLAGSDPENRALSLFITSSILSSELAVVKHLISGGALSLLVLLSSHESADIRREACWGLSNTMASDDSKFAKTCLDAGAVGAAIARSTPEELPKVRSECFWIIINALHHEELVPEIASTPGLLPAITELFKQEKSESVISEAMVAIGVLLDHHAKHTTSANHTNSVQAHLQKHCASTLAKHSSRLTEEAAAVFEQWFTADDSARAAPSL